MKAGTPSPYTRTARSWLSDDPAFAELARRVDDLVAIQQALERACPGIRASVASLSAGVLELSVPGASWASRLRQTGPSIIAALAREGFRVDQLKIRPNRQLPASTPPLPPRSPIPPAALSRLAEVGSAMQPGPLREALARLIAARTAPRANAGSGQDGGRA